MQLGQKHMASALVDHVDVGVIILDSALRIQYWNNFINRSSGKVLSQARQLPFTAVFPEADTPGWAEMVVQAQEQALHVHSPWRDTASLLELRGGAFARPAAPMRQSTLLFPFADSVGQQCLALLVYDSTELARSSDPLNAALHALSAKQGEQDRLQEKLAKAQLQLLQSEKLASIGQLAAGVAHEINNPIGYVFSNLRTLAGYVNDLLRIIDAVDSVSHLDELRQLKRSLEYDYIRNDAEALIEESEDGIERVKKIITALKDFSHIEEEEFRLADLQRGLETTLNKVNNELKYKAEVITDFAPLPEVQCIPSQINQVVMNLLINAAHAIEQFGRITLSSGQEGDWVWLQVEDTGKGIEPQTLKRIYEPFFTTKPVGHGTGLGLTLSYNIMQKHHGRIEVSSELGKGTRFRVWLPVQQPEAPVLGVQA